MQVRAGMAGALDMFRKKGGGGEADQVRMTFVVNCQVLVELQVL